MGFYPRFSQGMKAAVPIWVAFVPSSMAWGVAAQTHGLTLHEALIMSAWVYSGPAQFAVLEPLASGKSSLQVIVAALLMNMRFLPMSAALAPFFAGVSRAKLLFASHFVSASSFIVPYIQFQRERENISAMAAGERNGRRADNFYFFLGVGMTSFLIWVLGSGTGYAIALGVPRGFEEVLKFILPGYFAGLLAVEARGRQMTLICLGSLLAAVPGDLIVPGWGWLVTAISIATLGWLLEQWNWVASKSS